MLIPATLAADTVEGLAAEQGPERPWIYRLLLLGTMGALASLPFIPVDLAVRAPGIVRPALERIELRPASAGLVEKVLVRDNDHVRAGQPLLVLSTVDIDERLARSQALREEHAARIADLEAATRGAETRAAAGWRTPALAQEWAAYLTEHKSCELAEAKAAAEYDRCAALEDKGIVTRQELENTRFAWERAQAETRLVQAQARARWEARLQGESTALAALESEAERLEEERDRLTVRAPASGVLVGFAGWSAGGYLAAGQLLGSVSPDEALLVETQVSSRDAGLIQIGQRVRLQVDAYAYTWWGCLEGRVSDISGDFIAPERATTPGFKITIRPSATALQLPNGAQAELRKGLTVSARFLVARRSLLQFLYDESGAWLNPQDRRPG
jgi:HlyD family secretion protein